MEPTGDYAKGEGNASQVPTQESVEVEQEGVELQLEPDEATELEQDERTERCDAPQRVFLLLCLLYVVAFLDRGSFATNAINGHEERDGEPGRGVRGDFEMSNFQNGALSSLLMVGRVIGCLVTSWFFKAPPLVVIGMGMSLWTIAALGCAFSFQFYFFAGCRLLMGIGQAAVFSLGSVVVDDIAPEKRRTTWIAIFQAAPGVGAAAGFFYGPLIGNTMTWRYAFYFEAAFVAPLIVLCFLQKRFYLQINTVKNEEDTEPTKQSCGHRGKRLFSHILFDLAVIGDSLHIGYLSCLEYWAARALDAIFSPKGADVTVGVILFPCGIAGTLLGGILLDSVFGASVFVSLCVPAVSLFLTSAIITPAVLFMHCYIGMLVLFVVSLLIVFIPQAPLAAATLWTVPSDLRPLGRGYLVLFNQLLGTIPAPALYGVIVDWMEENHGNEADSHRIALASISSFLLLASIILFYSVLICPKHPNYKADVAE